jgi:hypothetical protein
MADLTIITNNVPRDVLDGYDLTLGERAEFDYLDWSAIEQGEDSASFFRYKGEVYDLGEFGHTFGMPEFSPIRAWDGYISDSFFSGIVVRFCDDFERVVVGRFYS